MPNVEFYLGRMEALLREAIAAGKTPLAWHLPHTAYVNASDEQGWYEDAQKVAPGMKAPVDLFQLPVYIVPGVTEAEIKLVTR